MSILQKRQRARDSPAAGRLVRGPLQRAPTRARWVMRATHVGRTIGRLALTCALRHMAACVGHAGEFVFLFHKELEIVF